MRIILVVWRWRNIYSTDILCGRRRRRRRRRRRWCLWTHKCWRHLITSVKLCLWLLDQELHRVLSEERPDPVDVVEQGWGTFFLSRAISIFIHPSGAMTIFLKVSSSEHIFYGLFNLIAITWISWLLINVLAIFNFIHLSVSYCFNPINCLFLLVFIFSAV